MADLPSACLNNPCVEVVTTLLPVVHHYRTPPPPPPVAGKSSAKLCLRGNLSVALRRQEVVLEYHLDNMTTTFDRRTLALPNEAEAVPAASTSPVCEVGAAAAPRSAKTQRLAARETALPENRIYRMRRWQV